MRAYIPNPASPGQLHMVEMPEPAPPGPDEVQIQHTYVGVNHTDLLQARSASGDMVLGVEGVGYVILTGENVSAYRPGIRVGYATGPHGAFAERRNIAAKYLVQLPDTIADDVAAALLYKGMTARYLTFRTFKTRSNNMVLVRGATGGVGSLVCQLSKYFKANVLGTVGSPEKIEQAKQFGCVAAYLHDDPGLLQAIDMVTDNKGVHVVYDTIGGPNAWGLLAKMDTLALYVALGETYGPVPPLEVALLERFSGFVTRPSIRDYKQARLEYVISGYEVCELYAQGVLNPVIGQSVEFTAIPEALALIANHQAVGSTIAKVEV